jgi:hypothetical protein
MFYNCNDPGGIIARRANNPWGPWSDATVMFHHEADGLLDFHARGSVNWL